MPEAVFDFLGFGNSRRVRAEKHPSVHYTGHPHSNPAIARGSHRGTVLGAGSAGSPDILAGDSDEPKNLDIGFQSSSLHQKTEGMPTYS